MNRRLTMAGALSLSLLLPHEPAGAEGAKATASRTDAGAPLVQRSQRAATPPARYRGQIHVTMRGFRNSQGKAWLALFRGAAGFPTAPPPQAASQVVPIVDGVASATFVDVAPGPFAITVLHDEDDDGKIGKSFFGIPSEGLGFSRDPAVRFGPPSFDDCVVVLGRGKRESMTITLRYY